MADLQMVLPLPNSGFNQRISIVGGNIGVCVDLGQQLAPLNPGQGVGDIYSQGVRSGLKPRVSGTEFDVSSVLDILVEKQIGDQDLL